MLCGFQTLFSFLKIGYFTPRTVTYIVESVFQKVKAGDTGYKR